MTNHLEKIYPGMHRRISKHSYALATAINYLIEPIETPAYLWRLGYKIEKPDISKEIKQEFYKALTPPVTYKKLPFNRLLTLFDGSLSVEAAMYLYYLIRKTKPSLILETGIASGFATSIMLKALTMNNKGELYSLDIHEEVGHVIQQGMDTYGSDKRRWHKIIGKPNSVLKNTLRKLSNIDIFLHDSDHTSEFMSYEYNLVYPKMKKGGYILSDDADENNAFSDFCKAKGIQPKAIYSPSKAFGIAKL